MLKRLKQFIFKLKSSVLSVLFSILVVCFALAILTHSGTNEQVLGGAEEPLFSGSGFDGGQWLVISKFDGYQTKLDPTKISLGANPQGQNTSVNEKDRVSIRNLGYDIFPTGSTLDSTEAPIDSLHTFRRRSGENVMMRSTTSTLQYYDETQDIWEILKKGLTSGKSFGFADMNVNADLRSYTYFGNAVDDFARWTGETTNLTTGATSTAEVLFVNSTAGFDTTGTVVICETDVTYTGLTASTFTGASDTPDCALNRSVAQAIETFPLNPKGNIYLNANNRLFIAGIASTTQAVFFSEYGVATDFVGADLVVDGTGTSPGIFNLGEGGGGVIGMAMDENSIYIFAHSAIYKATLTDTLYTLTNLKPFDGGKSQTIGSIANKSIFTGGNSVYFATRDNQIMGLERTETIDFPQVVPISDIILPTTAQGNWASSTGIVFQDKAYFAYKASQNTLVNDTILVWNIKERLWDSPILGLNVTDFTIYDDGNGEELYYGDAISPNTYKINDTPVDFIFDTVANWRTKQLDFGSAVIQKEADNIFIEGYISSNTTLTISLLLDEDGFTQRYSTTVVGTDTDLVYASDSFNVFGLSAFGTERFGSNSDFSGKKKFRVYLNGFRRVPFYNAQLEFASDGSNQQWEVISLGIHWRAYSQPILRRLFQSFK